MSTATQTPAPIRLAVSAKELATILDVSERHIWGMLKSGRLGPQPIPLGARTRWRLSEIEAWLAAGAPRREEWEAADHA